MATEIGFGEDMHTIAKRVLEFLDAKLEITQKKEEVKQAFLKMFKIIPDEVTENEARKIMHIPRDLEEKAYEILKACGKHYGGKPCKNPTLTLIVKRTSNVNESEHEWKLDKEKVSLTKSKNGFTYVIVLSESEEGD